MPVDAICLQAVLEEIRPQILGLRIDRVQQPARDQIILTLRGRKLLLHAGTASPRIQLTELTRENPAEPPMFCMLLRKHLTGAKISGVFQPTLERMVRLELDTTDEFSRLGHRTLILEAMGRRSNVILLDEDGRIIDCLRRVDTDMSASRQVLPGLFYEPPAATGRLPFLEVTEDVFLEALGKEDRDAPLDRFLLSNFFGLSPLMAREIVYRSIGDIDARLYLLDPEKQKRLWEELSALIDTVNSNSFTAILLEKGGNAEDFYCMPIRQYGNLLTQRTVGSFTELLDSYFESRERRERIRQRGSDLVRTATTARDRLLRKLAQQEKDLAEAKKRDYLRVCGDLITTNLHRMRQGQNRLVCENYYEDNRETVIELDPLISPQQNAARYYKRYTKAKTAEKHLTEQISIAKHDISYLESILEEVQEAESEQDFLEIREELTLSGFLKKPGKSRRGTMRPLGPREFVTSTGYRILVGRNNRQNERLTLKDAAPGDLWFHTQRIHGAHVILCTGGTDPDDDTITEAAKIAAWYSQGRESGNVPVDYTPVKNVRKLSGGRPGMVIYRTCRTVNVTPEEALIRTLRKK